MKCNIVFRIKRARVSTRVLYMLLKNNCTDAHYRSIIRYTVKFQGNTYLIVQSGGEHVRCIDVEFCGRRIVRRSAAGAMSHACDSAALYLGTLAPCKGEFHGHLSHGIASSKRARASLRVAVSAQYAETVHTNVG